MTQLYQPQSVFRHVCLVSCPWAQPVPSSLSLRGECSPPLAFFLWKASPPSLLPRAVRGRQLFSPNRQSLTDVLQKHCFPALWRLDWNLSSLRTVALEHLSLENWQEVTSLKPIFLMCPCQLERVSLIVCWLLPLFLSVIIVRKANVYGMPVISTCGIPGKALPVHYLFNFLSKQGINTNPI